MLLQDYPCYAWGVYDRGEHTQFVTPFFTDAWIGWNRQMAVTGRKDIYLVPYPSTGDVKGYLT